MSNHEDLINAIASEQVHIDDAKKTIERATKLRDDLIRAALKAGLPRDDIAKAADLKRARLYQIRDGRR